MSSFDRAVLALYSFCLTLALGLYLLVLAGWGHPFYFMREIIIRPEYRETVILLIGLFILGGCRLFWISFKRDKKGKHAILNENALGQVRISLQAMESLVEKVALQESGVRQVKTKINDHSTGISIHIKAVVTPDVNVPELSEQLQRHVKEYVFEVTGITVNNIKIVVENFAVNKPRVE